MEGHLAAEGSFNRPATENGKMKCHCFLHDSCTLLFTLFIAVHFRIRPIDHLDFRTLYPPLSAIVYWQIERVTSLIKGDAIKWEEQVRLKHMTTRQYLIISEEKTVYLTPHLNDPRTIYVFHNLGEVNILFVFLFKVN